MSYSKIASIIVLLIVASSSAVTNANESVHATTPNTRILRSNNVESNEERGFNFDITHGFAKLTASITSQAQLAYWHTTRTSVTKAFESMKLTAVEGNLFTNPNFLVWLKYVDDLEPKQTESAVSVLTTYYGDARLSKMIGVAMKDSSTEALARQLQAQRFEHWGRQNVSPYYVFEFLNLRRHDVLTNPMFKSWVKYLDDFNERHPTEQITMINMLCLQLGDGGLAKVLEAGRNAAATKDISTALQDQLFARWESMKFTPNDVFKAVGLKGVNEAVGPILSNPVLELWVRYLNEFNKKHPSKKTTMLDTIRKNYVDEAIVDMIVAAKANPATELTATNLELLLLNKWLREKVHPSTVARWLSADKSGKIDKRYRAYYKSKWPESV
ncbi:RxLR effector family protein [Phytophthora palmivora]|uniref:RxLR effector family protein n=1 Tax=Phytophthora palmivora TaxID=4796 RepID=A0A2P4Y387_9STRA|nr:RxLR effector family protein [Phytophthora palmivora]